MTRPLVLACGALARELRAVLEADKLDERVDVDYLPAPLHNRPEGIVPAIEEHSQLTALTRGQHHDRHNALRINFLAIFAQRNFA